MSAFPAAAPAVSNGATGRASNQAATGANPTNARVAYRDSADLLARGKSGAIPPTSSSSIRSGATCSINAQTSTRSWRAGRCRIPGAQDHFLTPTARYADIVLPATTFWERNDVHTPWAGAGHYAIYMRQAIQPNYECRNDIDIFADLAARLGIGGYNDKSESHGCESKNSAVAEFPAPSLTTASPGSAAPNHAVAFAAQDSRPTASQVHDTVWGDRDLLYGARRQLICMVSGMSRPSRMQFCHSRRADIRLKCMHAEITRPYPLHSCN